MSRYDIGRRKPVAAAKVPARLRQKLYVCLCETTRRVKCGIATNPARRVSNFQIGSPTPLRLIAEIDGDEAKERALHKRLTHFRVRGEWFAYVDDAREIIIDEFTSHLTGRVQFDARERLRVTLPSP